MNSHALLYPLLLSAVIHTAVLSGMLSAGVWTTGVGRQAPIVFVSVESQENTGGSATSGAPGKLKAPNTPGSHHEAVRTPQRPELVSAKPTPIPQPVQNSIRYEPVQEAGPTGNIRQEETRREETGYQDVWTPDNGGRSNSGYGNTALKEDPNGNGNSGGHGMGNGATGTSSSAAIADLPKPAYPRYSRIHGEEGTVVLEVEVSSDGKPVKIKVVRSSGYRHLDDAALDALQKASFLPARVFGVAVASTKRISIRFNIKERDAPL